MRRRDFVTLLGGAAATWPVVARAQQAPIPVIGYIGQSSPESYANRLRGFRLGLADMGYYEGRNVMIEYRWAGSDNSRYAELLADLVRRQVNVLVPTPPVAAVAAKAATSVIPIVFSTAPDPVQLGLVGSLGKPNGNVTGVTSMGTEIGGKLLSFAHQLLPSAARFALLLNPTNLVFGSSLAEEIQMAAAAVGSQVEVFSASTITEIDGAFARISNDKIDALIVSPSIFFTERRVQFATLTIRYALPAMYTNRDFVEAGGLMSYGTSNDMDRQVGVYVGRILKGEKPADLPVIRASKFELVINLQTARTLGLTVPPSLLAIADDAIE
jgi:putative tryptophan/tyrosine transport system substrate-binding protein